MGSGQASSSQPRVILSYPPDPGNAEGRLFVTSGREDYWHLVSRGSNAVKHFTMHSREMSGPKCGYCQGLDWRGGGATEVALPKVKVRSRSRRAKLSLTGDRGDASSGHGKAALFTWKSAEICESIANLGQARTGRAFAWVSPGV